MLKDAENNFQRNSQALSSNEQDFFLLYYSLCANHNGHVPTCHHRFIDHSRVLSEVKQSNRLNLYLSKSAKKFVFNTINCFLPYCTYFSLLFFSSLFNQEQRLWLGPWWVELFSQHFFRWRLTERLRATILKLSQAIQPVQETITTYRDQSYTKPVLHYLFFYFNKKKKKTVK